MNNVLILVAVRLKSSRLTKKAIQDVHGVPLIIRLTNRMRHSRYSDNIIWCTSINKQDDELEVLAKKNDILIYRGSELDVMSRFLDVASEYNADTIVRVTGDNPLTDPVMMDYMIDQHIKVGGEYSYTEDLPIGTRSEIIDVEMLSGLHKRLQDPNSSEYMTYMLNRPDIIKTLSVSAPDASMVAPDLRLTVDTPEDLELINQIYKHFDADDMKTSEIITYLNNNPELKEINTVHTAQSLDPEINCKVIGD